MTDADVDGSRTSARCCSRSSIRQMPRGHRAGLPLHRAAAALPRAQGQEGPLPEGPGRARRVPHRATASTGSRSLASTGPARSRASRSSTSRSGCKRFRAVLGKLDKRCDARVVAALLRASGLGRDELRDRKRRSRTRATTLRDVPRAALSRPLPAHDRRRRGRRSTARAASTVTPAPGRERAARASSTGSSSTRAEYQELSSIEQDVRSIGRPAPYVAQLDRASEHDRSRTATRSIEFIDERGARASASAATRVSAR